MQCNIDMNDRINRSVFGTLIVIGALLGFSQFYFFLLGTVMIVEGIIGWCGIPGLTKRIKNAFKRQ